MVIDLVRAAQDQAAGYKRQRDAALNRLTAAERESARLRAENATLLRIVADAFGEVLDQLPEPKPETEETK